MISINYVFKLKAHGKTVCKLKNNEAYSLITTYNAVNKVKSRNRSWPKYPVFMNKFRKK